MLLANPVPAEQAIDAGEVASWVEDVGGKELTPYLLAKVAELSEGNSLAANKALIVANARLAGAAANALAKAPL